MAIRRDSRHPATRRLCSTSPRCPSGRVIGAPTFFVRDKKSFVIAVGRRTPRQRLPAPLVRCGRGRPGRADRSDPRTFFRPPYVGHRGWIGVRLDTGISDAEIAELCEDAYRAVAPATLVRTARRGLDRTDISAARDLEEDLFFNYRCEWVKRPPPPESERAMPAVTVDDLTILPRIPDHLPGAAVRPVLSVTTAPTGFEGEGFPVHRAFAGVDLSLLDPFIMMDQMGEVEYAPGEPKGTPVAPAPRLRDRHLHHRRRLRPPGQPRRRRHHHQRRHPVDDRRRRHPAHRAAAGVAGPVRRPVPRPAALGQPATSAEVGRPPLPGPAQR